MEFKTYNEVRQTSIKLMEFARKSPGRDLRTDFKTIFHFACGFEHFRFDFLTSTQFIAIPTSFVLHVEILIDPFYL